MSDGHSFNVGTGDNGLFKKGEAHAIIANEDSIVIEWGVDKSKPENDLKDPKMRKEVDKINA